MLQARKSILKKLGFWFAVGIAYYIFICLTGLSIPCVFHEVTGLLCPGCGVTRMAMHLVKLEFAEAFSANALLFCMLPFFGVLFIIKLIFMPKWLEMNSRIFNGIIFVWIILALGFGIVRNLPWFHL